MKAIILAGGSGERFWPLSTKEQPKQFLRLFEDRSLIDSTFDRLRHRLNPSDIVIITSSDHVDMTARELPDMDPANIIGEPERMNTAPACVTGSLLAEPGEPVLTVPADHMIPDTEEFWRTVDRALNGLDKHGGIFTFGIEPTRPETGYGYIESGEYLDDDVRKVLSFREKPDQEKAMEFVERGDFFWNSGMFLWKSEEFFQQMKRHCNDVIGPLENMDPRDAEQLKKGYDATVRISIDYALMERSDRIRVVPAKLKWSDLGSWESIMEITGFSEEDEKLSLPGSENIFVESRTDRRIAVVDMEDLIVVDTNEGLLILPRNSGQRVREAARHFHNS